MDFRSITREEHEDARQVARDIAKTGQYVISMKLRKKVEVLFAHLKRILGLNGLRLRNPCGANDEFLLAATAQNLRKLAKIFPAPQQTRKAWQERRSRPPMRRHSAPANGCFSTEWAGSRSSLLLRARHVSMLGADVQTSAKGRVSLCPRMTAPRPRIQWCETPYWRLLGERNKKTSLGTGLPKRAVEACKR